MDMSLKSRRVLTLLTLLIICAPICVMAQPGFDPGVPDGAPIDGGLSMLAIAGVSYAAKKIYNKRKNQEKTAEE